MTISGVPIPCPAWEAKSLLPLWQGPSVRGSDRIIPDGDAVPYPRRGTVTRRVLELTVFGYVDVDGAAATDFREQLEENIYYFRANISDPPGTADGTRPAVLHLPSGATKSGPIHVIEFALAELGPAGARATLDISIPGGALA